MNKKQILLEDKQKKENIASLINGMCSACGDRTVYEKLIDLKNEWAKQVPSESEEVNEIDDNVKSVLTAAKEDLKKSSFGVVSSRIDKIKLLIEKRDVLCPTNVSTLTKQQQKDRAKAEKIHAKIVKKRNQRAKKGQAVADLYTDEELTDLLLQQAIDEQIKLQIEAQGYHDRLTVNRNDQYALAKWKPTQIKIETASKRIETLKNELSRTALVDGIGSLSAEYKEMIARRKVSSADFDVMMRNFEELQAGMTKDAGTTEEAIDAYLKRSSDKTDENLVASAVAGLTNSSANDVFNDPAFIAMGAIPNEKEEKNSEIFNNIDGIVSSLNSGIDKFKTEIDKLDDKRRDYATELKTLLKQRKTATASECITLDGEIDEKNAMFNDLQFSINRLSQERAILIEKRSLANKIKDNKKVSDFAKLTDGKFDDLSSFAMDIDKTIKAANDSLEDAGTANAVAGSTKINTRTMTGTNLSKINNANVKDEEKYAALEKELGM